MTILYTDLLGVRARWHAGGRELANQAFEEFRGFVTRALADRPARDVLGGVVETDSAAIVCASTDIALQIGQTLFRHAFDQSSQNRERRFWLRGAIVPHGRHGALRRSEALGKTNPQLQTVIYDPDLLDAIQVEKSGIKGMRLLVDESLCSPELQQRYAIRIGSKNFIPLKRLTNSLYPGKVATGYLDFFWMATEKEDERLRYDRLMAQKLRHAAQDPEEFIQAAATQVLFHEYGAIVGSIRNRLLSEDRKEARRKAVLESDDAAEGPRLTDGTFVRMGDILLDGKRELGAIISVHPTFFRLLTADNRERRIRVGSGQFRRLKKKT